MPYKPHPTTAKKLAHALLRTALLALALPLPAQTIFPVAQQFPAPMGLDFHGDWRCTGGGEKASLEVRPASAPRHSLPVAGPAWTALVEKQESLSGHYLVGYDRDHRQFLLVDADDPAYLAYETPGWLDGKLILTSVQRAGSSGLQDRYVYEVNGPRQFTFFSESSHSGLWVGGIHYTCRKNAR
ncbi:MAG: hypothetical protein M3O31_16510 [Acidobacteriota bacterium]|nr:hypothetical protein [Acidobacteriota bacterium]